MWTPPTPLRPPLPVSDWVPATPLSDENIAKTQGNQISSLALKHRMRDPCLNRTDTRYGCVRPKRWHPPSWEGGALRYDRRHDEDAIRIYNASPVKAQRAQLCAYAPHRRSDRRGGPKLCNAVHLRPGPDISKHFTKPPPTIRLIPDFSDSFRFIPIFSIFLIFPDFP